MRYVVDPRLLVDVLEGDPERGPKAVKLFEKHRKDILMLAPISYMALGPAFMGQKELQDEFLENLGVTVGAGLPLEPLHLGYAAYCAYCKDHPGEKSHGVLDSLYVGAYALLADGILTRWGELYRAYFPTLKTIEP